MGRANINLEEDSVWQAAYAKETNEGVPDMPWRRSIEAHDDGYSNKSMKQENNEMHQKDKDIIMDQFDHEYGEEEMIEMEEGEAEMFEEEYGGEDENEE